MTNYEKASAGMVVLFVVGLFIMVMIWILMGPVHDYTVAINNTTGSMGGDFAPSDERMATINTLEMLWTILPFVGIVLPLIVYAIVVSIRKQSGEI